MFEEKGLIDLTEEMQRQESVVIGFLVSLLRDSVTEEGIVISCYMATGINEDFIKGLVGEGLREFYKQYPRQRKGV